MLGADSLLTRNESLPMSSQYEFYRARAQEAQKEAAATSLSNVRERCLRAAEAWEAMAARALRSDTNRARAEAEKAAANASMADSVAG
jgi:hypothetical protein